MATKAAAAKTNGKTDGRAAQATEYVVLEQRELQDDQGKTVIGWVEAGTTNATIRTSAISEVAKDREGVWRAVPARSWAEAIRTRKETITKLKVEPVEPF
jgi:hypothetical protein